MKWTQKPAEPDLDRITIEQPVKFKYYMFDWDDNVLHMPTKIYLEHRTPEGWIPKAVSTGEFAVIRSDTENYRPEDGDWDRAFRDFYDWGDRGEGVFLEDTRAALEPVIAGTAKPGPSFDQFKAALMQGSLFAIITARAHSPSSILQGVKYFIENVLSASEKHTMVSNLRRFIRYFEGDDREYSDRQVISRYLNICQYWGVSSPEFQDYVGLSGSSSDSPEHAKKVAIKTFVEHVLDMMHDRDLDQPISVGFSDDDPKNVRAAEEFLQKALAKKYPDIKFVVYNTAPETKDDLARKIVVSRNAE